jgi:hypothetical protein
LGEKKAMKAKKIQVAADLSRRCSFLARGIHEIHKMRRLTSAAT